MNCAVILYVLLAAHVCYLSAVAKPVVIFRLDDVQAWWCEAMAKSAVDQFLSAGTPVNVGVIGKNLSDSPTIVSYLQTIAQNPLVEIVTHSHKHESYLGKTVEWQRFDLRKSIEVIKSVTGKTPTTFIPPFNSYGDNTMEAVKAEGVTIMSSECAWNPLRSPLKGTPIYCPDGSEVVAPSIQVDGVYMLPTGAVMGDTEYWTSYQRPASLNSSLEWINSQIDAQGFAVVMLHPVEFATGIDCITPDPNKFAVLRRLLEYGRLHWDIQTYQEGARRIVNAVPTPIPSSFPTPVSSLPATSPPTLSLPKVALRVDNIQSWWCEDIGKTVVNEITKLGVPVTIGLIGSYLDESTNMVEYLQSIAASPLVELASSSHQYEPYFGKTMAWQLHDLAQSKNKIMDITNIAPMAFIPPYSDYDSSLFEAISSQTMTIVSAKCNWYPLDSPGAGRPIHCTEGSNVKAPNILSNGLFHLPAGAVLGDDGYWESSSGGTASVSNAQKWIDAQIANQGFSVVSLTPFEFSDTETCSSLNYTKLEVLKELISIGRSTWEFMTLSDMATSFSSSMDSFSPSALPTVFPTVSPTFQPTPTLSSSLRMSEDFSVLSHWRMRLDGTTATVSQLIASADSPHDSNEDAYMSFRLSYCKTCTNAQLKLASDQRAVVMPTNTGVYWVGFKLRIPTTWTYDDASTSATIFEVMRGDRVDDPWPIIAIIIDRGRSFLLQSCGGVSESAVPSCSIYNLGTLVQGKWMNFVIRVNMNFVVGGAGSVDAWIDGNIVLSERRLLTSFNDNSSPYVKLGISNVKWGRVTDDTQKTYECPKLFDSGSYNGKCFKFVSDQDSWKDDAAVCKSKGGWLASITDSGIYSFINTTFTSVQNSPFWVGYTDAKEEGKWKWENGDTAAFVEWGLNQPSGFQKNDCAVISSNGKMYDQNCKQEQSFLCETDSLQPTEADRIATFCPSGFSSGIYNGFCYEFVSEERTWSDARSICQSSGGWLASIPDKNSFDYIGRKFGKRSFWIGYNDMSLEGVWEWDHGDTDTYVNWAKNEPSGGLSSNCAVIYSQGKVRDRKCGDMNMFLCQTKQIQPSVPTDDADVTANYIIEYSQVNVGDSGSCYDEVYTGSSFMETSCVETFGAGNGAENTSGGNEGESEYKVMFIVSVALLCIATVLFLSGAVYIGRRTYKRENFVDRFPTKKAIRRTTSPYVSVETGVRRPPSKFVSDNEMSTNKVNVFRNPVHSEMEVAEERL